MEQIIHNTPNWLYEAAACITKQYTNHQSSFMENHDKFGMTRDEMAEYMKRYTEYKEKVSSEIMPIYAEYPSLEKLFHSDNFDSEGNDSIALSLVRSFGHNMTSSLNNDEIDHIISDFIPTIADNFALHVKEEEIVVNNIEDVLNLLDKASIEDGDKMQILNLYRNRYEIIGKLSELLNLCAAVCQKHFPIIKEEFEKTIKFLNQAGDLEDLIHSSIDIDIKISEKRDAYSSIFCFNGLSMISLEDRFTVFIGIYFFDLDNLKNKNKFNDAQIVADLKALGDPTRLKIIHLLSKDNMYIQELAEKLKLTPATVSHHINVLLSSGFISITVDTEKAKKIYYKTNSEKFYSISNIIKALADNI